MKKTILTAILLSFCSIAQSQWVSNYWSPAFGDNTFTSAKGLANTVDNNGNCYVTGFSYDEMTGNDLIVIKYGLLGDTLWTYTYNGSGNTSDDKGYGIAVDNTGNVYVTGTASMTGDGYDIVIIKLSSSGQQLWAYTYSGEGAGEDKAFGITVDSDNNIIITGYYAGTLGSTDIITIKYDSYGTRLWTAAYNGPENLDDRAYGLVADNANNIYVTGYSQTSAGGNDIVLLKYNSEGVLQWSSTYNGSGNSDDQAFGITVDYSGNIIIAGYTTGLLSGTDCLVQKYNSSGTRLWTRIVNGLGNAEDKAFGIVSDNVGNVYVTGCATGLLSQSDYMTMKVSSTGNQVWTTFYNGTGNGDDKASAVAILGTKVVVTGASWGTSQTHDYATIKYDISTGLQLQATRYTMTSISEDVAKSLATSTTYNKVYVTGYSELIVESSNPQSVISTICIPGGESSELTLIENAPKEYSLQQNYPNPFNPSTTIRFNVSKSSNVKLVVYDMLGRQVETLVNGFLTAGKYESKFSSTNLPSGIYFYELTAEGFKDMKKMTLVK